MAIDHTTYATDEALFGVWFSAKIGKGETVNKRFGMPETVSILGLKNGQGDTRFPIKER